MNNKRLKIPLARNTRATESSNTKSGIAGQVTAPCSCFVYIIITHRRRKHDVCLRDDDDECDAKRRRRARQRPMQSMYVQAARVDATRLQSLAIQLSSSLFIVHKQSIDFQNRVRKCTLRTWIEQRKCKLCKCVDLKQKMILKIFPIKVKNRWINEPSKQSYVDEVERFDWVSTKRPIERVDARVSDSSLLAIANRNEFKKRKW